MKLVGAHHYGALQGDAQSTTFLMCFKDEDALIYLCSTCKTIFQHVLISYILLDFTVKCWQMYIFNKL